MEHKILSLDISSKYIKAAILSLELKIEKVIVQNIVILDENADGFAKIFDMDDLWIKICKAIKQLSVFCKNQDINIIGISSCAQRIASVFIDRSGKEIYGGPNIDIRGIDSAYIIDDNFSEKELFEITGHTPSLLFTLARLLWFKEESEKKYEKIGKVLMLDDWITYKLTGEIVSDASSAAESQIFDIKKRKWSDEIIEIFDFNPDFFPKIVQSASIVEQLKPELVERFGLCTKKIPIIKTGGDTQASLLGMGAINEGDIGITLGTTSPLQLVVKKPLFDSNCNYWTSCHSINDTWLIEAHAGNTGTAYNWFKETFINGDSKDKNIIINNYLKETKPGAFSTFAYLGPENMNIKNQTSIKRGVFVFEPPLMTSTELPKINHFARSVIENIAFGILENYRALKPFSSLNNRLFCAGGMSQSLEFCKVLANVLDNLIQIPKIKESSFIGVGMNILKAIDLYPDYDSIIESLLSYDNINKDIVLRNTYNNIYNEWKNIKEKIDNL